MTSCSTAEVGIVSAYAVDSLLVSSLLSFGLGVFTQAWELLILRGRVDLFADLTLQHLIILFRLCFIVHLLAR